MSTRDFSMLNEFPAPVRNIDNDAPKKMRIELLSAIFALADDTEKGPTKREIYEAVTGCLGADAPTKPYHSFAKQASKHLCEAEWKRTYDVVLCLAKEFLRRERIEEFRQAVNPVLAAHKIVWDVDEQGKLTRVEPKAAQAQVEALIQELNAPDFEAARNHFKDAQDAINDRPRRDRDACANAFDAMESVGRTRFGGSTFGDVLEELEKDGKIDKFVCKVLKALEVLRHNHFGHGNTESFRLRSAEVDFVYLCCVAGTLLLARACGPRPS